jgi:hypothetical protein
MMALAETADELYDLHLPTTRGSGNACLISSQDESVLRLQYLVARSPAASTLSTLRALAETADELYDLHLPTTRGSGNCLSNQFAG